LKKKNTVWLGKYTDFWGEGVFLGNGGGGNESEWQKREGSQSNEKKEEKGGTESDFQIWR